MESLKSFLGHQTFHSTVKDIFYIIYTKTAQSTPSTHLKPLKSFLVHRTFYNTVQFYFILYQDSTWRVKALCNWLKS